MTASLEDDARAQPRIEPYPPRRLVKRQFNAAAWPARRAGRAASWRLKSESKPPDGTWTYDYPAASRLKSARKIAERVSVNEVGLAYDPLGRPRPTTGSEGETQFPYEGVA